MRYQKHFPKQSLAKQSFKDECNINNIMQRFEKDGLVDHVNKFNGDYADALGVEDYHTSLNQVMAAKEAFLTLPSRVRANFDNDPGRFMDFVDNPENIDKVKLLLNDENGAGGVPKGTDPPNPVEPPNDNVDTKPALPGAE